MLIRKTSILILISAVSFIGCKSVQSTTKETSLKKNYYKYISTDMPLEKDYQKFGSKPVKSTEFESGEPKFSKYKIWYPQKMLTGATYPVVIITNGSNTTFADFEAIFEHLASWGFIVAGSNDGQPVSGLSSSHLLDFVISLNSRKDNILFRKVNLEKIGIVGYSQGGIGAIHAVTDYSNGSKYSSLFTASAPSLTVATNLGKNWVYDLSAIKIPYLMTAATGPFDANGVIPLASLKENFNKMNQGKLTVVARRKNADHTQMVDHADGYMTAWFRYTLMNDEQAKHVFVGNKPEIQQNTGNWQDVQIKN
jgi:hypothetical protein